MTKKATTGGNGEKGRYIILISFHGLIRSEHLELGRDSDTGGQTLYVVELVAPGVVNTMPEKTLDAVFDHGEVRGDTVTGSYAQAGAVLDGLAKVGVDYDDVTAVLEREGVEKFAVSWQELLDTVRAALEAAR